MAPKRPDVVKKQKSVQKVLEDPEVQAKLKKKVATKRAKQDIEKVAKNGVMTQDPSQQTKGKRKRGLQSYQIQVPNQKAFEVETPPDQIKMHQLLLAVAKKGGGKSTAVCNLLNFLKKTKC